MLRAYCSGLRLRKPSEFLARRPQSPHLPSSKSGFRVSDLGFGVLNSPEARQPESLNPEYLKLLVLSWE